MRRYATRAALVLVLALMLTLGSPVALAAPATSPPAAQTVLLDGTDAAVAVLRFDPNGNWGPCFELLLENRSDRPLYFTMTDVAVDGLMCDPFWDASVPAGAEVSSTISWPAEALEAIGIHYVQSVYGVLQVSDGDTFDAVWQGEVAWTAPVEKTDVPPAEPVVFENGFEARPVLEGEDVTFSVVDYAPDGADGPQLMFYMENHTDKTVYFTALNVAVNGTPCDPHWAQTVAPGMAAYSPCVWWVDDLAAADVERIETVDLTAAAQDFDTFETLNSAQVRLDLADVPASPAE